MKDLTTPRAPTAAPWVRNAALVAGLSAFALFFHAWFVDVAIHPVFFSPYAIVLALVPGAVLSVVILFRKAAAYPPEEFGPRDVVGALVLPFFLGLMIWLPLAKTPAWLAAVMFGTPHSETREFFIYTSSGKYECDNRARPTDDLRLFPGHLCVSQAFANQHHRQRVRLRLTGERTLLGFSIQEIAHDPAHADPTSEGGLR